MAGPLVHLLPALIALLLAGCSAAPVQPSLPTPSHAPLPVVLPVTRIVHSLEAVPMDWTGSTDTSMCIPSGPNACNGVPLPDGADAAKDVTRANSTSWAANLTLSWDAQTPLAGSLRLSVSSVTACGQGCTQRTELAQATGTSPLHLAFPAAVLSDGSATLRVAVSVPQSYPPPLFMDAELAQGFHLTGSLVVETESGVPA